MAWGTVLRSDRRLSRQWSDHRLSRQSPVAGQRGSKDPAGPVLAFTHTEWRAFLGSVGASDFDCP